MPPISTVVFDLGAVLIDWDPEYLYAELIPDPGSRRWFLSEICTPDWNHSLDQGRHVPTAVAELATEHPEWTDEIRAWWDRWTDMLALTNFSAETWPRAVEKLPFLDTLFEGVVVSGIEKVAKPDPAIYRLLMDRHDVDPADAVFIDDRADNVAAAEALGIRSHHFTSPDRLDTWLATTLG